MIALLRGTLVEKHPNQVILDVGGVGYDVIVPISTFSKLPGDGSETKLRIHTHVREDAFLLYGFLTLDEKNLFEKLISVSGIGPGLAVKVLSGMDAADVLACLSTVTMTRSMGRCNFLAVASMMRTLAWWGISQSMADSGKSLAASASCATSASTFTANLNTVLPSICK